jgi:hypothetical protein
MANKKTEEQIKADKTAAKVARIKSDIEAKKEAEKNEEVIRIRQEQRQERADKERIYAEKRALAEKERAEKRNRTAAHSAELRMKREEQRVALRAIRLKEKADDELRAKEKKDQKNKEDATKKAIALDKALSKTHWSNFGTTQRELANVFSRHLPDSFNSVLQGVSESARHFVTFGATPAGIVGGFGMLADAIVNLVKTFYSASLEEKKNIRRAKEMVGQSGLYNELDKAKTESEKAKARANIAAYEQKALADLKEENKYKEHLNFDGYNTYDKVKKMGDQDAELGSNLNLVKSFGQMAMGGNLGIKATDVFADVLAQMNDDIRNKRVNPNDQSYLLRLRNEHRGDALGSKEITYDGKKMAPLEAARLEFQKQTGRAAPQDFKDSGLFVDIMTKLTGREPFNKDEIVDPIQSIIEEIKNAVQEFSKNVIEVLTPAIVNLYNLLKGDKDINDAVVKGRGKVLQDATNLTNNVLNFFGAGADFAKIKAPVLNITNNITTTDPNTKVTTVPGAPGTTPILNANQ